jgi:hypothetical protein
VEETLVLYALIRYVPLKYLIARHEALPLFPATMLRRDERTMAWE